MREILFRGKRFDNGEWVYGWYTQRYDTDCRQKDVMKHIIDAVVPLKIGAAISSFRVIPETVGQFTGLKDKNGKDIYEGDKTKQFQVAKGVVIFRDGAFGYELDGQFISYAGNPWFDWNNGQSDEIEIIGNIHDNPELLEESK